MSKVVLNTAQTKYSALMLLNSLPNDKVLDCFKLKALAGDKKKNI